MRVSGKISFLKILLDETALFYVLKFLGAVLGLIIELAIQTLVVLSNH